MSLDEEEINKDLSNRLVLTLQAEKRIREVSNDFMNLPTDIDRINFSINILNEYNLMPTFIRDAKSNEKATRLRKEGNDFFIQKQDEDALRLYNYSVAKAAINTEELALAYANRSAVLFKLKLFEECLKDIERAFQNKYPEKLEAKLYARKFSAEELKSKQLKQVYHQKCPQIPPESLNDTIECASNAVKIEYTPELGRHIIATRDIKVGEIIAVEKPVFTLLTARVWCHCHHCLTLCYNLIPCLTCTQVLFCSEVCRTNAKKYHDYECSILRTVDGLNFNACRLLPLRIAVILKDDYKTIFEDTEPDKVYRSGRYKEIHNLVTNQELRKPANLFERSNAAAIYYHLVKNHTRFFQNSIEGSEDIFKQLILRHIQIMACNFHSLDDMEWNPPRNSYEALNIASGAYSFLSLFNHSCAPNLHRVTYGTSILLHTTETVKKGQQLLENYGYHYGMHTRFDRRDMLRKQYFFECECRACVNDWGTYNTLPRVGVEATALMLNYTSLANADLKVARKILPTVEKAMARIQNRIPTQDYCEIQELYKQCQCVFGNIRRNIFAS